MINNKYSKQCQEGSWSLDFLVELSTEIDWGGTGLGMGSEARD